MELKLLRSTDSFRRDLKRKHFCLISFTGTRIRIDSVMRPRYSSGGIQVSQLQLQLQLQLQFVNTLSDNRLWEFYHICNLRTVGDEDKLIRL